MAVDGFVLDLALLARRDLFPTVGLPAIGHDLLVLDDLDGLRSARPRHLLLLPGFGALVPRPLLARDGLGGHSVAVLEVDGGVWGLGRGVGGHC